MKGLGLNVKDCTEAVIKLTPETVTAKCTYLVKDIKDEYLIEDDAIATEIKEFRVRDAKKSV